MQTLIGVKVCSFLTECPPKPERYKGQASEQWLSFDN